ncbi:MAG: hypothetical protein N3A58_07515 [Spirochaetes bacterium]|nr:hypothetical protein [Spirochaetota bacterium]
MFNKNKEKEIKLKYEQIKERYKEFEKLFGKECFNYEAFENRYINALTNKIDLEIFFKAEEEALEQKYLMCLEKQKKEKNKENSFTKKAENILEEYDQRLKKYPYNNFYDGAHYDLKYLYGALILFYNHLFPYLETIFNIKNTSKEVYKEFEKFYTYFNYYCYSKEGFLSKQFQDIVSTIKHSNDKDVERIRIHTFVETGKIFNELLFFINNNKTKISKDLLKIKIIDPILVKAFKTQEVYTMQLLEFIINWIKNFLHDFRISEFK